MPRGKSLTAYEKGQIMALHLEGKTKKEIARRLSRSDRVVRNFLRNPEQYCVKKHTGRKRKLKPRDERRIIRAASNTSKGCLELKQELNLDVSHMTVWRTLYRNPYITRSKMKLAPCLQDRHKAARLEFARVNMNRNWTKVSFSYDFHV